MPTTDELRRARVLVVSHACIRSTNREVYRCLNRMGYSVTLLIAEGVRGPDGRVDLAEPFAPGDPPTHFLPTVGSNLRLLRFPGLSELLSHLKPEIVFVEADPASLLACQAAVWCQRHGSKLVCRTAENLSWLPSEAVKRVGWRELLPALAKLVLHKLVQHKVAAVCTTNSEAADLFRKRGYKRVLNVPMGTDCRKFRYRSSVRRYNRARLGIPAGVHAVAYFGRMVPQKSVETLIEALAQLEGLPWIAVMNKFEVASAYAKQIEAMIDTAGLRDRVIWVSTRHGQIADIMMATDVIVLPSRTTPKVVEQFGRVVPEGLACGALVLVSDSGAPKELVPERSLVFPEGDARELAAMLTRFASDPAACRRQRRRGCGTFVAT